MKFHLFPAAVVAAVALAAASLHAQAPTPAAEPDLSTLLRDALFEEEATRDLTKAAAGYEALLAKWAGQRPLAAAALYRLAEVRRKQDRKDDAIKLYQRLLTEFPDIDPHARLSRENLAVLGVKESPPLAAVSIPADPDEEKELRRLMMLAENSPDKVLEPVAWPESGSKDGKIGPLCNAAMRGWAKVAAFLLDHGAGPNTNGFLGGSPLYAAAANGHKAICELLFAKGAKIETAGGALGKAIASNYTAVAELLMAKGANINDETTVHLDEANRRGWVGFTPLAVAISRDNKAWIDRLLALKADVNAAPEDNHMTALHVAAWKGNRIVLQKLLDLGAKPDAPDNLQENGAAELRNPGTDALGWRALHYAAADAGMTEALLKAGANPSIADSHGLTPLHVACLRGELACVKLLLAAKADVNASGTIQRNRNGVPEYSGITPLHAAALTANPATIEALLAAGANPNPNPIPAIANGQKTLTPLALAMDAVRKDNLKGPAAIAALLKAKADPNGSKDFNLVAAALAIPDAALRDSLLAMLIAHGADPEPAIQSAPVHLRIPLLRSHRYPKLAAEPAITLSIGHMLYQKSLSRRAQPEEKPASLPSLLLAWHDDNRVNDIYGGTEPDWSTLHLWRKGDSGKLTETVLPLKPGMDFPVLQWGDVIEVLSSEWDKAPEPPSPNLAARPRVRAGFASPASFMLRLPPATLAILRSSQSARITFKTGDFSKSLTLRGVLRTYDFTTAEAPLLPVNALVTLLAGNRPGMVKLERTAERGGGTLEWATGKGNDNALPEEGDTITFTPDAPKADEPRVSLRVPGQPGVWQNAGGDQSPTLLQFLGDLYGSLPFEQVLPEEARGRDQRAAALQALTPEQAAFNLVSGSGFYIGRPQPHWPDWSGVKVRRRIASGKNEFGPTINGEVAVLPLYKLGEPESIDLLTAMKSLTVESTPEEARKFDLQLNPGDEVELPVLKDHPPGPWPGFDEAALRLFTKALTAKVTVVEPDGRFRETTRAWLPPRWVATPAGVLPIPDGDATGGRTPWLRARDLADSVAPGLRVSQVIRDAASLPAFDPGAVFLRPGDILHLQSGGMAPRPARPPANLTPPLPGRGLPSNGP